MPKLVQAVGSCRAFRKKPVGPLGAHVNMVEGCNEQLSRAVEGELGGLVTAFLCDNRYRAILNLALMHRPGDGF